MKKPTIPALRLRSLYVSIIIFLVDLIKEATTFYSSTITKPSLSSSSIIWREKTKLTFNPSSSEDDNMPFFVDLSPPISESYPNIETNVRNGFLSGNYIIKDSYFVDVDRAQMEKRTGKRNVRGRTLSIKPEPSISLLSPNMRRKMFVSPKIKNVDKNHMDFAVEAARHIFDPKLHRDASEESITGAAIAGAYTTLLTTNSVPASGIAGLGAAYVAASGGKVSELARSVGDVTWKVGSAISKQVKPLPTPLLKKPDNFDPLKDPYLSNDEREYLKLVEEAKMAMELVAQKEMKLTGMSESELLAKKRLQKEVEDRASMQALDEVGKKVESALEAERIAAEKAEEERKRAEIAAEKARAAEQQRLRMEREARLAELKCLEQKRIAGM